MNSEKINRWLTLGANIGVFAGLILVAYEINQSGTTLELAASSDSTDNFQHAMEVLVQEEGLARLIFEAENSFHELDEFERWRVSKYLDGYMSMSEQDFGVFSTVTGEIAFAFEHDWRENMSLPMYREYWSQSEERYSPEFRQYINDILTDLDGN